MSKHAQWLETETERWTSEGIISADQAAQIRGRYAPSASSISWGLIVFFGLGAVVIGLGIILLFAYNWTEIPKAGKLTVVFGALIAAHASGLVLRNRADWRGQVAEALTVLGTMLFGAGIWLVAQIYNIDEHFPTGFLIWAMGALTLAWLLESIPQAILAAVLIAIWGGVESMDFSRSVGITGVLLLATLLPVVYRRWSALLLAVVIAALYWLVLCHAGTWGGSGALFGNALALSVLLIALAKYDAVAAIGRMSNVLRGFGLTGFVICAYVLSFHDATRSVLHWAENPDSPVALIYRWLAFALAALAWGGLLLRTSSGERRRVRNEEWLIPIALVYSQAMGVWSTTGDDGFVAAVFNLICLGTATAWMVRGCRETTLPLVVRGSLLLAAVVFARYFDLFDSLAVRGLVFLGFGAVLFAEGFFYRRVRLSSEGGQP